jgi:hypothetical protein
LSDAGDEPGRVVVTDVKMPFVSMVVFLVKLAIAAIPAMIILTVIGAVITALTGAIFHGLLPEPPAGGMRRF